MSERARRVDALFQEALDAPDREAFLAACGELRDDVSSLLIAHDRMGGFLATPAWERLQGAGLGEGDRVGRYTIRRKIAEGGGGAVYEAEQEQPRRIVALKLLKRGTPRWLDEAEILAKLKHPDIATVHEAGVHEGTPYIAMEYVEGETVVAAGARLPERAKLELFTRVCDAVHYGHLRGVIHRDLKPANVLVRDTGPKVIDFGIAAVTGGRPGEVMGTLPYMSPEQCDGADIDARSDVYSLGVILCLLASGRLPCSVDGLPLREALRVARGTPPPDLGGDLGAIVSKALARDRDARYASAATLAEDVRRYLRFEPVAARPHSLAHATALLFRRRTGVAASLAALLLVLVAGVAVSLSFALRAERRRAEAVEARDDAELRLYVANLGVAEAALRNHDVAEARRRLLAAPGQFRDWEWRHLYGQVDVSERSIPWPGREIWAGAASADGRLVAVSAHSQTSEIAVWDAASATVVRRFDLDRRIVDSLAFSPDGRLLASGGREGEIEVTDIATGAVRRLGGHAENVNELAFDARGELLASASRDATIRVVDVATGQVRAILRGHADRVICVRFGPDGRVFSGGREGDIRIWTGERTDAVLRGHEGSVEGIALSPDGARLASVSRDLTLRLWDVATLRQVAIGRGHIDNVRAVAFGANDAVIATASYDHTVRLWDARDLSPLANLLGHTGVVRRVELPGDGSRAVSFGPDRIRFWPVGGVGTSRFRAAGGVSAVALSGDDLVAGADDGSVRRFDLRTGVETGRVDVGAPVGWLAVGAGRTAVFTKDGRLRMWRDGADRPEAAVACNSAAQAWDPARGRVYFGAAGVLRVVDERRGEDSLPAHDAFIVALALDPLGRSVASAALDGRVRLFDAVGFRGPSADAEFKSIVAALCFSPDGKVLAAGHRDGSVSLLDARTLRVVVHRDGHSMPVTALAFHPSGRRLASGAWDGFVRLWDVTTGTEVVALRAGMAVNSLAFDASGARLAVGIGTEGVPGAALVW